MNIQIFIKNFIENSLKILNEGQFFEENFLHLLFLGNILENMNDFQSDILNEKFLNSILYFLENKKSLKVSTILARMLTRVVFDQLTLSQ